MMMTHTEKATAYLKNFIGTSYEVGTQIGKWTLSYPGLHGRVVLPPNAYPHDKFTEIHALLDSYCPGVNEEIRGFSDTVGVSPEQALFYAMTYLERGCSLMAALPRKTESGHTVMARSYDFCDSMEDMCFAFTDIKGKYRSIGSTLNLFGRCDGMNEHGLAVCKASNGLPVGNFEGGQKAGVTGFSFWIVVRSILENCKDVDEAIQWAMAAPIAYNINLMLADSENNIALLQCIDGHKAYKILDESSDEAFLSATNHTLLEEIKPYEKVLIENSVIRNDRIVRLFAGNERITVHDIKRLLSATYPDGLCCHYYKEFFGTLRSMIFDTTDKTIEMSFGSPQANEWQIFPIAAVEEKEIEVSLPQEKAEPDFYKIKNHVCEFLLPLSGVDKWPELTRGLNPQRFREYYYLKSELVEFCRKEQLSVSGSKAELTDRIEAYLQTGERVAAVKLLASKPSVCPEMSLTSVIEENFRCSERHRDFFKSVIGDSFKFNVEFQTWLKTNAGKTYADAVSAYKEIAERRKTTTTDIGRQFEYNAYIRAFFEANKGRSLAQAIACWKHKKSLPGHNRYEYSDLGVLGPVRRSES